MRIVLGIGVLLTVLGALFYLVPLPSSGEPPIEKDVEIVQLQDLKGHPRISKTGSAYTKQLFESNYIAPAARALQKKVKSLSEDIEAGDIEIILLGIIKADNGWKVNLTSADKALSEWVGLNDEFQGWQVSRIMPNEVDLNRDGTVKTLMLFQPLGLFSSKDDLPFIEIPDPQISDE